MIWLVVGIFVLGGLLYMAQPLYAQNFIAVKTDSELADYARQISDIDAQIKAGTGDDKAALLAAKAVLGRQLLAGQDQSGSAAPHALLLPVLFMAFGFGALGLYSQLGRPELLQAGALKPPVLSTPQAMSRASEPEHQNDKSMDDLIAQLEIRLKAEPDQPDGWMLYARSLMHVKRYDDAFAAYAKVLSLTDNNPNVYEEFNNAREFAYQQRISSAAPRTYGPSQEQMNAAAEMSDADRAAMIEGMVTGLSQKLMDNPDDKDGWIRLLRARKVMNAGAAAQAEIKQMQNHYKDQPQIIDDILTQSGWK